MKKKQKIMFLVILMILMMLVLIACGGYQEVIQDDEQQEDGQDVAEEESSVNEDNSSEDLPIMTMEEVAENDGRDGNNAYIVVEGIVYDVTNSRRWSGGNHNGFQAGQDLTEKIIGVSPHGRRVLDNMEEIGRIE